MYIMPVTLLAMFVNIPLFINLQVKTVFPNFNTGSSVAKNNEAPLDWLGTGLDLFH
jgi:hypothetical protein